MTNPIHSSLAMSINFKENKIHRISSQKIGSLKNLLKALDVKNEDEVELSKNRELGLYRKKTIKKKDGSDREVYAPVAALKNIQRKINSRFFGNKNLFYWPDYIYGSIKNQKLKDGKKESRDYVSCANRHNGAKSLLTLDIKNFFDNIHEDIVEKVIREFITDDSESVQWLLGICCHKGGVLQGAPTSSYIANMSLFDVEPMLVSRLNRKGLVYTRLVDDITVSSKVYDYDFSYALTLIENALIEKALYLNKDKLSIRTVGSLALTVHGLRVDYQTARLPASEVGQIRAHVKNLEDISKSYKARTSYAYRKDYARCMGRVSKLARVGHKQYANYINRLKNIRPIPSGNEGEYCLKDLINLEGLYENQKDTYGYRKSFYRLQEKVNILARSFEITAKEIKERMKKIAPPNKIK